MRLRLLVVLFFTVYCVNAQQDTMIFKTRTSVIVQADSIKPTVDLSQKVNKHSPHKATIYSAILPGLGQAYNKKYWKIPVIYGLTGVLTYFAIDNNKEYVVYKDAYKWRLDDNSATVDKFEGIYSDEDLRILKNYYRRNRDLSFIGLGVVYLLNVVDAAVDAHLFYFDVSDDLSLKVQPGIQPMSHTAFAGVKLSLQIK